MLHEKRTLGMAPGMPKMIMTEQNGAEYADFAWYDERNQGNLSPFMAQSVDYCLF
jgi:hypothetical protein